MAEISFVLRYGFIEIFSSAKKLFACINIDNPEKETENAIATSFVVFGTKYRAEILFTALLISKNGKIKV